MVQIFDEWRLHDEIDESRTDELDESRAEATTTLRPPGAEDTTTRTVGHSMTKTMPARSAPVVRLVGPLHDTSGGAVCGQVSGPERRDRSGRGSQCASPPR